MNNIRFMHAGKLLGQCDSILSPCLRMGADAAMATHGAGWGGAAISVDGVEWPLICCAASINETRLWGVILASIVGFIVCVSGHQVFS